jgi:DNA polymerase III subunit chi
MAEIHFHTLQDVGGPARLKKTCSLIEQAFLRGEKILVWLEEESLTSFDNLLWTFGDRSFVPHEMLATEPALSEAPVQLFAGAALPESCLQGAFHTLVMLRTQASPEVLRFNQVIEVVDADVAIRNAGRARFKYYREQGHTPKHLEESNSTKHG